MQYRAPRWLAGHGAFAGNVQTIWPALYSKAHVDHGHVLVAYRRERWDTPDGDFIDVDFLPAAVLAGAQPKTAHKARVQLVLFHGLEGSSQSHYARAFAHWAHASGWDYVVPHFRGCSGELNRAPRTYHSGDHAEINWILRRLAQAHAGPTVAVGVSLGGNALLRWAQEAGNEASQVVKAVVAISSPVDLAAAGHALGRGFNRQIYTRMFLNSMKPKALAKLQQFPGLANEAALRAARDLYEYDNAFTAPLHGFANTEDYWARCSAKPGLKAMRDVPALVLNARNDPFVPASSLPTRGEVGPAVTLWQPHEGGHVGFPAGRFPGHVADLPETVGYWLKQQLSA
ncbi:MAG: alpha/beta fold hydrolase [Aquabacterium sp.]|uniref:YheT family hydrolase n=1 Tax=Aquabacterium sp. TaxID=1872578 RepID=UPI001213546B|nr:alpha/beta fold hydrolase [Aquabacterium sp.]TAK93983.1 MAG: alpha/beta fold hydrolase [Aquabacterium sp.]